MFLNICKQTFHISHVRISQKVKGVLIWNFQDIILIYEDENIGGFSSRSATFVQTTERVLEKQEREKKRQYNNRIMNIEHGTFTPLVFSVTGVMGKECSVFHKHIADKIARKTEQSYNDVISVIRCKLSFLILRSALLCIRGSRSHTKYEPVDDNLSLIFVKARCRMGW